MTRRNQRCPSPVTEPKDPGYLIPVERIGSAILDIRWQKAMLGADLAAISEVSTRRLKEQVRRNLGRFPQVLMFELTFDEKDELAAEM